MSAATPSPIMKMVPFCRRRNASAPSLMAPAISCICGVPSSAASTCRARYTANASDRTLMSITSGIIAPLLAHPLQALEPVRELLGHVARLLAPADHVGRDEDEQLRARRRIAVDPEHVTQDGDVHEVGHAVATVRDG